MVEGAVKLWELFTPTINPIHAGVYEVHKNLHDAIMNRDARRAVKLVREHTSTWIAAHDYPSR